MIGGLSVDGVTAMTWPALDLIRSFEMPGLIFERLNRCSLSSGLCSCLRLFRLILRCIPGLSQFQEKSRPIMFGLLPVMYLLAMTPKH
ncbi:GerAB/ArcD/ProY family transporter [Bacillus licheniformis]|nr:GerAB/ArcD/ProY family transporter [Bacillus licheniformis]